VKLLIRADADPVMGTGHVMRCLALAQAWQEEGGEVGFLTAAQEPVLWARLRQEGLEPVVLPDKTEFAATLAAIARERPDWVVLDGYHFTPAQQRQVKELGARLLVIDDYAHLVHYYADLVLNQNFGAEKLPYQGEPYSRFLLGPAFALLRREFRRHAHRFPKVLPVATKLLITLGGADPHNYTLKILNALNQLDYPLEVRVVLGPQNPHRSALHAAAPAVRYALRFYEAVEDMPALMSWADAAVAAGGSTVWELCYLGLPSLLGIIADNQENSVNNLARGGYVLSVGHLQEIPSEKLGEAIKELVENQELRKALRWRCRALVDGRGAHRVLEEMALGSKGDSRRENHSDYIFGDMVFKNFVNLTENEKETVRSWRNKPEIRKWMFTSHIISKQEHNNFIKNLENDNNRLYYMVSINGNATGVCSLVLKDNRKKKAHIGIYTVEKGKGNIIMENLLKLGRQILGCRNFVIEVFEENVVACTFYKKMGFKLENCFYLFRNHRLSKVLRMSLGC